VFSDKAEELLDVSDLHTEELHKILLCEITFHNHMRTMVDYMGTHMVFSLLSGNQPVFLYVSYAMAVGLQGISLTVILVFSEVKCFEGSVPAFKLVSICPQNSSLRNC